MIGEGGTQDPEDDRHRAQKARGEHQGEDLRFITDLDQADDQHRNEESFHYSAVAVAREIPSQAGVAPAVKTLEMAPISDFRH